MREQVRYRLRLRGGWCREFNRPVGAGGSDTLSYNQTPHGGINLLENNFVWLFISQRRVSLALLISPYAVLLVAVGDFAITLFALYSFGFSYWFSAWQKKEYLYTSLESLWIRFTVK